MNAEFMSGYILFVTMMSEAFLFAIYQEFKMNHHQTNHSESFDGSFYQRYHS